MLELLQVHGALLRETPDAIITRVLVAPYYKEVPIIAFEFSGALPAGNNAWQRCGRALASVQAGIPYIYFGELGGVELNSERGDKGRRLPNPIIPFAYLALNRGSNRLALPAYLPSPSISAILYEKFKHYFSHEEPQNILRTFFVEGSAIKDQLSLEQKAGKITASLAKYDSKNKLKSEEWETLVNLESGAQIADWFVNRSMNWSKRLASKVKGNLNNTFTQFLASTSKLAYAISAKDLPFCIVSKSQRHALALTLAEIYPDSIDTDFIATIAQNQKHLVIVWLTGFKPMGEDSRPDRGLVPLIRMIFGEAVDILSVIYGPGKEEMWLKFSENMWALAKMNGLWQSVLNLSDYLLIDNPKANSLRTLGYVLDRPFLTLPQEGLITESKDTPRQYGEHDVDTVLHLLFTNLTALPIFEGFCNPPGGNWSGVSVVDHEYEYRWVSLPRVSGINKKRPDHVFEIFTPDGAVNLLIVESKDKAIAVENEIGPRLKLYIQDILANSPNIIRNYKEAADEWHPVLNPVRLPHFNLYSMIAFQIKDIAQIDDLYYRGESDAVIGMTFSENKVALHIKVYNQHMSWLVPLLQSHPFDEMLVIHIH